MVIPCHKTQTIDICVNSILNQSIPVEKVIVIADGVEVDGFQDAKVEVRPNPSRLGKALSINAVLGTIKTELVLLLDCDAYLGVNGLQRMVECLHGEIKVVIPYLHPSKLRTWIEKAREKWYQRAQRGFGAPLGLIGCCILTYARFLQGHPFPDSLVEDQVWAKDLSSISAGVYQAKLAYCRTEEPGNWGALMRQLVRWWYGSIELDARRSRRNELKPYFVLLLTIGFVVGFFAIASSSLLLLIPSSVVFLVILLTASISGSGPSGGLGMRYLLSDMLARFIGIVRYSVRREPDW